MTINNEKIVLITWANWWLWKSLVKIFLDNWYIVFAWIRNLEKDSIWEDFEGYNWFNIIKLDVTNIDDINNSLSIINKVGKLDILINNAWISWWGSFWERELSFEKKVFDVNLWGALNMVKTYFNQLEKNNWLIVNIGSISGLVPTPFLSSYSSSKVALEKITLWIFLEKNITNVRLLQLNLWPLNKWLCWSSIKKENDNYQEKIRKHMIKLQNKHWYEVDKVSKYILNFTKKEDKYKIKTLWLWSFIIVFLAKYIPQPYYQKLIWKYYKSI